MKESLMKILFNAALIILLAVSSSQARVLYIPIEEMPSKADFTGIGTVIDST